MAATYLLHHKLFVSSHLITVCFVTLAVAFVPLMLQGKEWARILHITCTGVVASYFLRRHLPACKLFKKW